MYGYESYVELSPEHILQKITQEQIFELILKVPFDISGRYCSPFRDDKNPGCRFETRPDGTILFIDFGERLLVNGRTHRNCFRMVMDKYGVSMYTAINMICKHFDLSTNIYDYKEVTGVSNYQRQDNTITKISYDKKDFSKSDIQYWSQFLIRPEHLLEDGHSCVRRFTLDNHKGFRLFTPYQHCYAFDFVDTVKIYQPFNEKYKWISSCDEDDIGNIDNLPATGKELIIQKSYKDHRILRNLEWGLNVIWFQNEGCVPSVEILRNLVERFQLVTIFYDNDKDGIMAAMKLATVFNEIKPGCVRVIYLPERKKHKTLYGKFLKDTGEFISKEGKYDLIKVLKQIGIHGKNT